MTTTTPAVIVPQLKRTRDYANDAKALRIELERVTVALDRAITWAIDAGNPDLAAELEDLARAA